MNQTLLIIGGIVAALILVPALIAGAGLVLAVAGALIVLVLVVGGQLGWEYYNNKHMGAAGRKIDAKHSESEDTIRDLIGGNRTKKRRRED